MPRVPEGENIIEGEPRPVFFSFICPNGREVEVFEIVSDLEIAILKEQELKNVRIFLDPDEGDFVVLEGTRFMGSINSNHFEELLHLLAEEGIAGYSRATQVVVYDENDETKIGESRGSQ